MVLREGVPHVERQVRDDGEAEEICDRVINLRLEEKIPNIKEEGQDADQKVEHRHQIVAAAREFVWKLVNVLQQLHTLIDLWKEDEVQRETARLLNINELVCS